MEQTTGQFSLPTLVPALSGNTRDISPLKRSQGEPIRWGATE